MQDISAPTIMFGLLPFLFLLVVGIVSIALFAFWLWMLIDCLQHEKNEDNQKLVWALVIIFTNWIGALIYFFVRRKERKQQELEGVYSGGLST